MEEDDVKVKAEPRSPGPVLPLSDNTRLTTTKTEIKKEELTSRKFIQIQKQATSNAKKEHGQFISRTKILKPVKAIEVII